MNNTRLVLELENLLASKKILDFALEYQHPVNYNIPTEIPKVSVCIMQNNTKKWIGFQEYKNAANT